MTDADTTLHVEKLYRIDKSKLYAAIVNADLGMTWWPPKGFTMLDLILDAYEGGPFKFTMRNEETYEAIHSVGVFREVVEGERLVWENGFEGAGLSQNNTMVTLEFDVTNEGTWVIVNQSGFEDAATRDLHKKRWESSLDNLAVILIED